MENYKSRKIDVEILDGCPEDCLRMEPECEVLFADGQESEIIWKCGHMNFCRGIFSGKGKE